MKRKVKYNGGSTILIIHTITPIIPIPTLGHTKIQAPEMGNDRHHTPIERSVGQIRTDLREILRTATKQMEGKKSSKEG